MAVKIRLARKGRKRKAFYHIVVANSRSPRDGRYIEKIGLYNPITDPAIVELDFDKALGWLQKGAVPTDTCRSILSSKGVLLKRHLLEGVKKGAFDEAEAEKRFDEWKKQHDSRLETKKTGLEKSLEDELAKRLDAEKKVNEARAARVARKQADLASKADATEETESTVEQESIEGPAEQEVTDENLPEEPEAEDKSQK
jgi:small subunit ribosomal protein S16